MVAFPKNLNEVSKDEIAKFLNSFDTIVSDCDGVLWIENDVIPDSDNTVNKFQEKKSFFYVTNNNSKASEEYAKKCNRLGFLASSSNIICASYLVADYLKSINFKKKVYLIGNEGLAKELDKAGIAHIGLGPDIIETNLDHYFKNKFELDPEIGCVVLGFDVHLSYPKMMKAATYLMNPDCIFLAACSDESLPGNPSIIRPGTGCYIKFLEAATGRKALVVGKPSEYLKNTLVKSHSIVPGRTLMIGDRCNTDILFGKKCGFQTLLVLSGVHSIKDVEKYVSSSNPDDHNLVPNFYIKKLGDLFPYM